eukprot:TRINITY_DN3306_c0_g1_i1.p2 TRINITY_DN3306_c0_g1~~TRINITY_DN3306_c0_g1_i1.p2  ORF type:complete len:225 (-),score=55.07 TRINITY_DN3306_c0_g1_i1:12-686(-)
MQEYMKEHQESFRRSIADQETAGPGSKLLAAASTAPSRSKNPTPTATTRTPAAGAVAQTPQQREAAKLFSKLKEETKAEKQAQTVQRPKPPVPAKSPHTTSTASPATVVIKAPARSPAPAPALTPPPMRTVIRELDASTRVIMRFPTGPAADAVLQQAIKKAQRDEAKKTAPAAPAFRSPALAAVLGRAAAASGSASPAPGVKRPAQSMPSAAAQPEAKRAKRL